PVRVRSGRGHRAGTARDAGARRHLRRLAGGRAAPGPGLRGARAAPDGAGMSSPMSSRRLEERLEGAMLGRVVGRAVLPAVPDHEEPGAGQDADRVRVVVAACDGAVVEVGRPGVGADGVASEVADGVAELLVGRPPEVDGAVLAGLAGAGRDAGEAG